MKAQPSHGYHAEGSSLALTLASNSTMALTLTLATSHLSNISTRFYGEVTQQMLKHADFPGSNNGTGLFQTIVGLKIRDLYEQITSSKTAAPLEATKA
ncbi:hypothetical protein GOBAR_AA39470 [Gossypium barbadense]|uniref:Uncharacterized protein n=1 Tax=Gossypium barbadense TaxID=3634 RepID=A0A2P5VQZ9_GOSBA|nr:hypothetical protein GOBAR_AA39470 [Gossypium barbadense]